MEEIFKTLFREINDAGSFDDSLEKNIPAIEDFFNAPYQIQSQHKDDIERLILLKNGIFSRYTFQSIESRSFVLILLDLCERFALYSCIPRLMNIIQNNGIAINKRMTAALKFLFPSPSSNSELVEKFDEICDLLNSAIIEEEDNPSKAIVTFLNYYGHIIYNTNFVFASEAKSKLCDTINSNRYSWLNQIEDISHIDVYDSKSVYQRIEEKIDYFTRRRTSSLVQQGVLIEEDTDYCTALSRVSNSFLDIRRISVNRSSGVFVGRGVDLLNSEDEMYEYIKRYGRMHYAKLLSSFESTFPQNFDSPINIVDWGCGQAIATMTFLEKYSSVNVINITLIEPSEMVLRRGALHCKKFRRNARINTVCKKLDEVVESDINCQNQIPTVHLFSNILDIDDYNMNHLLYLVDHVLTCKNYFVCVSPYIDDIKTARLNSFMNHFRYQPTFLLYHSLENTKSGDFWQCNNSFLNRNFSHGDSSYCGIYDSSGCVNKWTRVLKVFSV